MNIIVYGAGALGSFIGGMLSVTHTVTLVGRHTHMNAVNQNGLRISGKTNTLTRPAAVTEIKGVANLSNTDLIILTVKAFDTPTATKDIVRYSDAPILSLQNGLNNEWDIADIAGANRSLGGVTTYGVRYVEPGHVCHTGIGDMMIGELDGSLSKRIQFYAEEFAQCKITVSASRTIIRELWRKALVNAAINPLSAILRCKNGYLLQNLATRQIMGDICNEGSTVARVNRVDVGDDVMERIEAVAHYTRENQSSMLESLLNHKRTEIDQINGAFISFGRKYRIATPVNTTLTNIIKALEK